MVLQHRYANASFDADLQLDDGATSHTSAGQNLSEVAGADKILDLMNGVDGVGVGIDDDVAYFEGDWWNTPTQIDFTTADEKYDLQLQFSNEADFASDIVVGPQIQLGDARNGGDVDQIGLEPQRIGFDNLINGILYRYVRQRNFLAGTTPILKTRANITKRV